MNKLPTAVPLPEVDQYTEDIVFGPLGLPATLDEERLLVNVRAMERVRKVAGLGAVSVRAVDGETSQYDAAITSVNLDGTATLGAAGKRTYEPLGRANTCYHGKQSHYGKPDSVISINRPEIDEQVQEAARRTSARLDDPVLQARALDRAVTEGLIEAARQANMGSEKIRESVSAYLIAPSLLLAITPYSFKEILIAAGWGNPIFYNLYKMMSHLRGKSDYREFRKSVFYGCAFDRYLAATGIAKASRLIRAQK